ncbi:hypothetical protein B0J14DRAFT_628325 [Halenospora varia]|nr:hypothetical protein B0J14DRAFT_628325 [Halenospora varia]
MFASKDQSSLNTARGAGATFGPNDTDDSSKATPATSVGSATAAGHGQHPQDMGDDSNTILPGSKQMRAPGEGEVMDAQFDKKNAGWGGQANLTSDLDRQKAEQKSAREDIKAARNGGANVDGGLGRRVENEGLNAV